MITGIFGLPGVGKTLLASWIANRAVQGKSINKHGFTLAQFDKQYQRVYTNFPIQGAYMLDFETIGVCKYEYVCMICDELQLFADSRNFKTFSDDLKAFFSEHRKHHIDFIWLSQSPNNADKRIRDLTHRLYYIDRWYFNLVRCREIVTEFDVASMSTRGYFAGGINTHYFYAPALYKYCDTYHIINPRELAPPPALMWGAPSEPARLGTTTHNGKGVEILSDGNAYYTDDTDVKSSK